MSTTPLLLTDKNIEVICGELRTLLQRHQLLLESDWNESNKHTLKLRFDLELKGGRPPGTASLKMEYEPVTRSDSVRVPLWDVNQESLSLT